ncbi:hypothetical protein PLICRDRAFT_538569 [Plicaturopsis crispa FD-325 SS-3]|nr:hypothetical protein PLICRDRAFT_538569 [Plicaturopsis crispa FD-325 SS-3]
MDRDQDKQPRKFTVTSKPIIPLDVDAVQPSASSSQSQGQTSSGSQSANIRPTFYQPPTQMVQLQGWHDPSVATSPSFQHQSAPFVPTPHSFFPPPPPPPQRTYVAPPSIALQDASAEDEDDMYAFHIAPARARTAQACEKCRVRKTKM